MDTTPRRPAVDADRTRAELRAALQRTIPLLGFVAGLEVAERPEYANELLAAGTALEDILAAADPLDRPGPVT